MLLAALDPLDEKNELLYRTTVTPQVEGNEWHKQLFFPSKIQQGCFIPAPGYGT